jgi:hypothetical protein
MESLVVQTKINEKEITVMPLFKGCKKRVH